MRCLLLAAAVTAATIIPAHADDYAGGAIKSMDTAKGEVLTDARGMTLYTFDKDAGGKSMCNDDCAKNWPPLMAPADAKADGKWSVIKRDDGMMQYAYDGKPLYTFMKDEKPGDMTGDKMKSVWHVVRESQK